MRLIGKLKSESGHAETFYIILMLGVSAAILTPALLRTLNEVRSRECLTALARAANQEIEMGEASCPVPNLHVENEAADGVERYFLAGSEDSFQTSPVFIRTEGKLTFEQSFPHDGVESDSDIESKRGVGRTLHGVGEEMSVETKTTLSDLVIGIVVGLVLVFLIWLAHDWGCLPAMIVLALALFVFVVNLIISKSTLIDPAGKQVHTQTTLLRVWELEPRIFSDPIALVPFQHHGTKVLLLHRSEGAVRAAYLFTLDPNRLGELAAVDAAFRVTEPGDPVAGDEALEEPGGGEELPSNRPSTDEEGNEPSLLSGKMVRALPHLVMLMVGSLLISILAESIAGGGSFSLPFGNVFIVTLLGTGLSPFFGWTSTGILLAVYTILYTAGVLDEGRR